MKSFSWLGSATVIVFLILLLVAASLFTFTGSSTVISYEFILTPDSYAQYLKKLNVVVDRENFKSSELNSDSGLPTRESVVWRSINSNTSIHLESMEQADSRFSVYLAHSFFNDIDLNTWSQRSQKLINIIPNDSSDLKIRLQLDPDRYGKCASPSDPNIFDTICIFSLRTPPDFNEIECALNSSLRSIRRHYFDFKPRDSAFRGLECFK